MPTKRVYVGNLPNDVRRSEIEDLFYDFRPDDINLPQKSQGFAFLIFDDARDAEDAIKDMDGVRFAGRRLRVEVAGRGGGGDRGGGRYRGERGRGYGRSDRYPSPRDRRSRDEYRPRGRYCLALWDLPRYASWQDLKDFAREHGCAPPINTDVITRSGKLMGLLEFANREELEDGIKKLDKQKVAPGRGAPHLYEPTAVRAYEDDGSRSRSRDRSRSRSRSKSRSKDTKRRSRSLSSRRSRSRSRSRKRSVSKKSSRSRSRSRKRSVSKKRDIDNKSPA